MIPFPAVAVVGYKKSGKTLLLEASSMPFTEIRPTFGPM